MNRNEHLQRQVEELRAQQPDGKLDLEALLDRVSDTYDDFEQHLATQSAPNNGSLSTHTPFLSALSHEIRTPLNAIIGMIGMLESTSLNAQQKEFVHTIQTGSDTLLRLINDLLDLSRIQQQSIQIEQLPVTTAAPLEDVVSLLASKAHAKGLDLMYYLDPGVPQAIRGDASRLRQVLIKFISHAIHHTHEGEILISVRSKSVYGSRHELEFSIKDTGTGFTDQQLSQLFQPFEGDSRILPPSQRLGLVVAKGIIEGLGGTLSVESEPGIGTTYCFTLQAEEIPEANPALHQIPEEIKGKVALVLDDNQMNLHILSFMLSRWGMEVVTEDNPLRALQRLREGLQVDLVISDVLMPELDGKNFILQLREFAPVQALPAIMLTSGADRQLRDIEHLIAGSLTKPGRQSQILRLICQALTQPKPAGKRKSLLNPLPPAEPQQPLAPRVLLVEDNSVNQRVAMRMLSKIGYEADLAENGQQAVEMSQQQRYDLILMDLAMPVMDGLTATQQIRSAQGNPSANCSIIALTANASNHDRAKCEAVGMNGFLSKPVTRQQLEATLQQLLAGETATAARHETG